MESCRNTARGFRGKQRAPTGAQVDLDGAFLNPPSSLTELQAKHLPPQLATRRLILAVKCSTRQAGGGFGLHNEVSEVLGLLVVR